MKPLLALAIINVAIAGCASGFEEAHEPKKGDFVTQSTDDLLARRFSAAEAR